MSEQKKIEQLSLYIDCLNAEKKPAEHSCPQNEEWNELLSITRLVKSLKETALPENDYPKRLAAELAWRLKNNHKTLWNRTFAWVGSLKGQVAGAAAVLVLALLATYFTTHLRFFNNPASISENKRFFEEQTQLPSTGLKETGKPVLKQKKYEVINEKNNLTITDSGKTSISSGKVNQKEQVQRIRQEMPHLQANNKRDFNPSPKTAAQASNDKLSNNPKLSPEGLITTFFTSLEQGDYRTAYSCLSSTYQSELLSVEHITPQTTEFPWEKLFQNLQGLRLKSIEVLTELNNPPTYQKEPHLQALNSSQYAVEVENITIKPETDQKRSKLYITVTRETPDSPWKIDSINPAL